MTTAKSKAGAKTASNEKHPGGRPRLYECAEAFAKKTDEYFASIEIDATKKPTLTGLCLFMGFCDKESFSTYATYGDEFSRTVTKARLRIEEDRVQILNDRTKFTPGTIFDLKNNYGWKDKQELELSGNIAGLLAERRKRAQ